MNRPLFPYPNSRDVEVSNPFRGERDHREHTAKRCWNAVPYDLHRFSIVIRGTSGVSNPFRGERDHREHTAKRCWEAVPYDFRNRYVVIIPAAVKLFRRRERKIGTGADVLAYVKVVPVAPFEVCGRIFKAGSAEAKSLPLLALASSSPGRASARPSLAGKPARGSNLS